MLDQEGELKALMMVVLKTCGVGLPPFHGFKITSLTGMLPIKAPLPGTGSQIRAVRLLPVPLN